MLNISAEGDKVDIQSTLQLKIKFQLQKIMDKIPVSHLPCDQVLIKDWSKCILDSEIPKDGKRHEHWLMLWVDRDGSPETFIALTLS